MPDGSEYVQKGIDTLLRGLWKKHPEDIENSQNLFPLLGRYDQFIEYNVQQESYKDCPLNIIENGHVTGALSTKKL